MQAWRMQVLKANQQQLRKYIESSFKELGMFGFIKTAQIHISK